MIGKVIGALVLSLIASAIFFFVERGFLEPHFFHNDAQSTAEQAKIDALKAEAIEQEEAAAKAQAEAEADRLRRQEIERENQAHQQQLEEENRRAQIQERIEAEQALQKAKEQAEEEAARQRALQQQQELVRQQELAQRRASWRGSHNGCDLGTYYRCFNCQTGNAPECLHIGGNGGCLCEP
ncbi:MAG TPA: hypothetical protein VMF32_21500 [Xanthobacteraceae bacterium]|nr:hypothetical protein [Xanthobacteraceae bacterium]